MTLQAFIKETGPKTVAQTLGVDPSTVSCWRLFKALPNAETMVRIHKLSQGKVTYQEMVETYARKRKQQRNT